MLVRIQHEQGSHMAKEAQDQVYKKSNDLIVMIPFNKDLTILSRKLYSVLLWETQNQSLKVLSATGQKPSFDHLFEARLVDIFSLIDEDYKDLYTRAKKCFRELRRTEVEWQSAEKGVEEPWDNLGLLSQAGTFKRNKEMFARWSMPPEITSRLINHGHYTLIDLKQIVKLRSYAAIALYEIFARYKTIPGGCTSSHSPQWWTSASSHKPTTRTRDWRKVKYETIQPALDEISELTDIIVERPEEKRDGPRNSVTQVYFKIQKKTTEATQEGALPIELIEKASRLSVSIPAVKEVVVGFHHGDRIAHAALDKLENTLSRSESAVENPTPWFRTVAKDLASHVSTKPASDMKKPAAEPELKQSASNEVRQAIKEMPRSEQIELLDRAVESMRSKKVFTAQAALKYKSFKEESGVLTPLFLTYMVEVYKSDQPVVQANAELAE
jgi:hypothetical protein